MGPGNSISRGVSCRALWSKTRFPFLESLGCRGTVLRPQDALAQPRAPLGCPGTALCPQNAPAPWDRFPPWQSSPGQPAAWSARQGFTFFIVWKEEISRMRVLQPIMHSNTRLI